MMIGRLGPFELLLIVLIILLLFGARRLPDLARALGRGLSEFRKGRAEGDAQTEKADPAPANDKPTST